MRGLGDDVAIGRAVGKGVILCQIGYPLGDSAEQDPAENGPCQNEKILREALALDRFQEQEKKDSYGKAEKSDVGRAEKGADQFNAGAAEAEHQGNT